MGKELNLGDGHVKDRIFFMVERSPLIVRERERGGFNLNACQATQRQRAQREALEREREREQWRQVEPVSSGERER